jgi:hypothetical protein
MTTTTDVSQLMGREIRVLESYISGVESLKFYFPQLLSKSPSILKLKAFLLHLSMIEQLQETISKVFQSWESSEWKKALEKFKVACQDFQTLRSNVKDLLKKRGVCVDDNGKTVKKKKVKKKK